MSANPQRPEGKRYRILAVASEWFSFHGGLSTFNRSLCAALATAGHDVTCLLPAASAEEIADARGQLVKLLEARRGIGLSMDARLCLPLQSRGDFEIVIGHGHITGPAAAARREIFHRSARCIHFLHTLPEELEWYKSREEADAAERAQLKQDLETHLSISGTLAVAVGPRLARLWSNHMSALPNGVLIHRMNPGLPAATQVDGPPPGVECLLLGRIEDMNIKGADIVAAAIGLIAKDERFRGAKEPRLVVRGAKPATSEALHKLLKEHAKTGILLKIKDYTHDIELVRQDIARASVLLMPSRVEGFGLVGLEALAMGVPVLISNRSGLGELLLERIESDASLGFASKYVVDVQDHMSTDAEHWAAAIGGVLLDREGAFRETAMIRDALQRSEYWPRAVSELFNALDKPVESLPIPSEHTIDQFHRAIEFARHDPAVSVAMSTELLERAMEETVVSGGIAKVGLRPEQYVALLSANGVLKPSDATYMKELIRRRNQVVHNADSGIDQSMAEDHARSVEKAIELLKPSVTIDTLSIGPVNPSFGATGCFYIAVRNGPVPLWPTLKMADFSDGALNETAFVAHWRGPVTPHVLSVGEPQQYGLLGIATLPSQNPVLFVWAQDDTRTPVTRDLPLERQEPIDFVVTFYGKYKVVARRIGEVNYEVEKVLAKRKYRVAPDTSHDSQFKYNVVSEQALVV